MTKPVPDEAIAEAVSTGHARLPNGNLLMGMPLFGVNGDRDPQAEQDHAMAATEPGVGESAPGNAEVAYEQWIEHRNPEDVGSMAGFTAGWQAAITAASGWPLCPNGCKCRLGTADADQRDCACDGLCCYDEIEVGEVFAERDKYRKVLGEAADRYLVDVPTGHETANRPRIVCLCGSTRFYDQFQQANYDLTMRGEIVLSVGFYPHAKAEHGHGEGVGHDSAEKTALDELHKRKIDLADYVLVLSDEAGYFGQSTAGEIAYAVGHGKTVRFAVDAARECALAAGLVADEIPSAMAPQS
jgi:hypothetical protein